MVQVDDVGQFPGLPAKQEQMGALPRQLHNMPMIPSTGTANHVTSNSGSVQGPPKDGFALANSYRMVRKMSSMRITGKATGCRVRAASPLSKDVFAKKFHRDTTDEELSDYLIANTIIFILFYFFTCYTLNVFFPHRQYIFRPFLHFETYYSLKIFIF